MRTVAITVASIAVASVALVLVGVGSGSSSRHASLRLAKTAPLEVAGSHFRSHERVRVSATVAGTTSVRHAKASGTGSFLAEFSTGAGRCSMIRVVAVGQAGSRATLKRLPGPACMPA